MSIGNQNEITVRVTCLKEELEAKLKRQGFKEVHKYRTADIFLVPKDIDIYKENTRFILSRAILLRDSIGVTVDRHRQRITFKSKNIAPNGEILSQYSVNCDVINLDEAEELFKHIGYKRIMKIAEEHISFKKDNLKLVIKYRSDKNILIEIETNEFYKTTQELKNAIDKIDIPFDHSNYYVKKAEEELDKIKNNGE